MMLFRIGDIIKIPFGYLIDFLYQFTHSYGLSLILFSILVRLILTPMTAKSKKNTMKMSRLQPQIQYLQKKYEKDQNKLGEEMRALYKAEGVSMGAGCLWSLLPLLFLIPLYTVVRQPIIYMLGESKEVAEKIVEIVKAASANSFTGGNFYDQMVAAPLIPEFAAQIK